MSSRRAIPDVDDIQLELPQALFEDFCTFGEAHVRSGDIDPVYPVLKFLHKMLCDGDEERRLWLTALYLAYYNLTSAVAAWRTYSEPGTWMNEAAPENYYPTGIERRGLRGGKIHRFLNAYSTATALGQEAFIRQGWGEFHLRNYERFWITAQTIEFNGRWAAFKWSEILKKVHGYELAAPDMRMEFCSGPKEGLAWLYDLRPSASVELLNNAGLDLMYHLKFDAGVPTALRHIDWETLETILCDFNSMRKGHYYVGHDIDQMQSQIEEAHTAGTLNSRERDILYQARRHSFPVEYLGELTGNDWAGVDRDRDKAYRDYGYIHDGHTRWQRGKANIRDYKERGAGNTFTASGAIY